MPKESRAAYNKLVQKLSVQQTFHRSRYPARRPATNRISRPQIQAFRVSIFFSFEIKVSLHIDMAFSKQNWLTS